MGNSARWGWPKDESELAAVGSSLLIAERWQSKWFITIRLLNVSWPQTLEPHGQHVLQLSRLRRDHLWRLIVILSAEENPNPEKPTRRKHPFIIQHQFDFARKDHVGGSKGCMQDL